MIEALQININWMVIIITLLFIMFDFTSGFVQACANRNVSSTKLREGLFHKCGFIFAICFGILCEWSMQFIDLGFDVPIATAICVYIILTEITSILENLGNLSPEFADSRFLSFFSKVTESGKDASTRSD